MKKRRPSESPSTGDTTAPATASPPPADWSSEEESAAQGAHSDGSRGSRHFPLSDLALNFEAVFVDHIGSFLDPVDIARLAMTCTWGHGWGESPKTPIRLRCSDGYRNPMHMRSSSSLTERLYEQVCKKLGLSKFFNPLWCGSNTPSLH